MGPRPAAPMEMAVVPGRPAAEDDDDSVHEGDPFFGVRGGGGG